MSPALAVVTGRVAGRVEDLLGRVREAGRPPRPLVPALPPAVLAGRELRRLRRAGNDPFAMAAKPSGGLDPVRLWLAALTRRV
jgi:hypothetical protein